MKLNIFYVTIAEFNTETFKNWYQGMVLLLTLHGKVYILG